MNTALRAGLRLADQSVRSRIVIARGKRGRSAIASAIVFIWAAIAAAGGAAHAQSVEELRALSIDELANLEITSVSKRPERLSQAPAAVYVITNDDIRRSGAISLPEALRLAPNLQVARLNAQTYAISARGFNSVEASIRLLVLIDGRSIYTPLHAGVFWDQQQVMLEDIERIEVISGPGGTLWGANAVNGVINVITKHSKDTQGGLASVRGGNVDQTGDVRYGGKIGDNATYRTYGLGTAFGESATVNDTGAQDHWSNRQGGSRTDWSAGRDGFTVQGDLYDNRVEGGSNSGGNVLGRWTHQLSPDSALEVQAYYDQVERLVTGFTDRLDTFDLQAQHSLAAGDRHRIVWGGGYRVHRDEFVNTLNAFVLDPDSATFQLANVFAQDSISVLDDVTFTVGTKFEHSSLSGLEYLPSARLAWHISENAMIWSAVSRAVRTPSRFDRSLTAAGIVARAADFESEKLIAYEVGIRGRPSPQTSLSVSAFYNDYDDLRVLTVTPAGLPAFGNRMEGNTYGVESWGDYRVLNWWRLSAGLTILRKDLHLEPGALRIALDQHQGNDPDYQFQLRSSMDLSDSVEWDVGLRKVDSLPSPAVPSYLSLDTRIGWQVTDSLELSLAGFNLLDDRHPETGFPATRGEVRRTVYAGARLRF
jgi:iron complex outermembrane receptor protein